MDPLLVLGAGSGLSWEEFGIAGVVIGALLALIGLKLRADITGAAEERKARLAMEAKAFEAREKREDRVTVAVERISLVLDRVDSGVEKIDTKVIEVSDQVCAVEVKVDKVQHDLEEVTGVRDARRRRAGARGDGG